MRHNNNPKNKKGFLDFQRRQLELSRLTEQEARKARIESNLEKWVDSLPDVLKYARPTNIPKSLIEKIKNIPLKPPYDKQVVLIANNPTVSTFTAYSILYVLIRSGIATPSEIKKTSLMDGYNNINGMFNSRRWKDYFFDEHSKILFIEGSSKSLTYLGPKGEDQFWRELNDFVRNQDKLVIITYTTDSVEKDKELFVPVLTSDTELNKGLIKKSIFVPITAEEEEEIETKQEKAYRKL